LPLKLNIGLSQKVSDANYGSRGASVNVELEVESTLVNDPGKLLERIRQVFNLVRTAVTDELNSAGQKESPSPSNGNGNGNGHHQTTNGERNGNGNGQRPSSGNGSNKNRPATVSQVRAIKAIANRVGTNLDHLLHDRFHVARPDDLSIGDASSLIDELKAQAGT